MDGSCSSYGDMTISELRNRLRYVKHCRVPLPLPRSSIRPGTRGGAASGGVRGDLRITVRASPSGAPPPSSTPQPVSCRTSVLGPLLDGAHHVFPGSGRGGGFHTSPRMSGETESRGGVEGMKEPEG